MTRDYPATWSEFKHRWTRRELLAFLDELTVHDPCKLWAEQQSKGQIVGFDEVIHFFFDDHDFSAAEIGFYLFDENEARLIKDLKEPLDKVCDDLPEGSDLESVAHPLWPEVRRRAEAARLGMRDR